MIVVVVLNIIVHFEFFKLVISESRYILMWSYQNGTLELLDK